MPIDQITLDKLFENGSISPETYKQYSEEKAPISVGPTVAAQEATVQNQQTIPAQEQALTVNPQLPVQQVQPEMPVKTQEVLDAQKDVFDKQQELYKTQIEASDKMAGAASQSYSESMSKLQDLADREQTWNVHKEQQMQDNFNTLQSLQDEIGNARIDPSNLWANMSTGGKIAAAIGLALGAVGGTTTGGVNKAAEIMNQAINRDVEVQKANIDKKRMLYNDILKRVGDERAADAATKSIYLQKAQLAIQNMSTQTQSATAKAQAQALLSQLELQKQQYNLQYQKAMQLNAGTQGEDNVMRKINYFIEDPKDRTEAIKEFATLKKKNEITNMIDKAVDEIHKGESIIPGAKYIPYFKQGQRQADALRASLVTTIMSNSKGGKLLSENGLNEVINPLLPKHGDDTDTLSYKKNALKDIVYKNFTETPILSGYGWDKTPGLEKLKPPLPGKVK